MFYGMYLADSVDAGDVKVHQVVHKVDDLSSPPIVLYKYAQNPSDLL
jgi:hypothetical protein